MPDRLPRICFVAPHAYPVLAGDTSIRFAGGAELQQVLIARHLVARDYKVSMICLDYGQEDKVEIDGVVVHRAFRQESGLPVLRFVWPRLTSILSCLRRAHADIYYQRAASMLTGVLAAYCKYSGKKGIFSVAGEPKIRFGRDRWLYDYGIRNIDCIVVQNAEQERSIAEAAGRSSVLIPNLYDDHPSTVTTAGTRILWVGTIRQVKRPDVFLDVVAHLPQFRFTMVGGPDQRERPLYESVESRARNLENLDFVGFVPYAEIDEYFDDAILFVNTSDSEGFPNTFLQSWARSVPTVSFVDSGARFDSVSVGYKVDSTEEMTQAIIDLMEGDMERVKRGEMSRRYVEDNHLPDRVVDQYENLFRRLLDTRQRS